MGIDWEDILGVEEELAEAYDDLVNEAMDDYLGESDEWQRGNNNHYVVGVWNGEKVRFKHKWGNHEFSEQEINDLLSDKVIRFPYTINKREQDIVGKLEHLEYKGRKYVGFSPSNWKK
ncbi:hypothetical protein [Streptococcus mitis]|uniref:DNA topoisomerase I n=1 Tax=Streptococcus mitis SK597 TaxID=585204 RepID=E1LTC8_STRMT|nr:hypothetical protein [Streptococcus mitis]EFO00269.1 hypothetical protein SMSK597_1218 [Streptococcus mitis SK597]